MAGVSPHGRPGTSCSINSACLATLDNTTARMHLAAAAQLCSVRSSELRRCWQLDSFFDAVLVISLKSRMRERGSAVRAELSRHGSSRVIFVEGVDGRRLVRSHPGAWAHRMHTDEIADLPHPEGAIGCLLGHYAAHRRAADLGLETYLVLEDDVVFRSHMGALFRQAVRQLPAQWDMIYLGYNPYFRPSHDCQRHRRADSPCAAASGVRAVCRATGGLVDAHAIGFHARARAWLLPMLTAADRLGSRLMPYDLELRASIERNQSSVHAYAVLPAPMVVQNKSLGSDIYVEGMYAPDAPAGS